jgi:phenylalanyl-tRNA synthetase beta chain
MPTISVDPVDLSELLGQAIDESSLQNELDLVKGEYKGKDENGCLRIELNDTNRPDLWSTEGIVRQLRAAKGKRRDYPFFGGDPRAEIHVEPELQEIRPYVAGFVVRRLRVTDRSLQQIIQTQEKLAENFGRMRSDVAIGVYNLKKIQFPVAYRAVSPSAHSYVPLGFDEPMSLQAILARHPKGIQYGPIIAGKSKVPLLQDAGGLTLSMPPIINSRDVGEVVPGDSDLFVEATGTNIFQLVLAMNIMACDLSDRGGHVERVRTVYPFDTPLGREVDVPRKLDRSLSIPLPEFTRLLGVPVKAVEVDTVLEHYGCDIKMDGEMLYVYPPPTRADYLHPVDVVEDFAIARGYQTFEPRLPRDFSPGRLDRYSVLENRVRDLLVGMGYEEIISNILSSKNNLRGRMKIEGLPLVEISNVMNENYAALRDSLLPSLLQVEARSQTASYPHRLFETGDVAIFNREAPHGSDTRLHLGVLLVHAEVTLSEIHADLEHLIYQQNADLVLREIEHPSFLPGRSAEVVVNGKAVGILGEVHPAVLERWEIGTPAAAFEIRLGL